MKVIGCIILVLLLPALAVAGLQPADFAFGIPLSLEEGGAVYRLSLPLEVYQTVQRADLGDMRVFNKAGAVVPFMLRRPMIKSEKREQTTRLPLFPLYQEQNATAGDNLALHFEKNADGTILNIRTNGAKTGPARELSGYIIDASSQEGLINALDFFWQPTQPDFVTTVSLAHSSDLTHWSVLVNKATLAQMNYGGHQILQRRLQLPSLPLKYIRMSWTGEAKELDIQKVSAVQLNEEQLLVHQWQALSGKPVGGPDAADKAVTAFDYDSGARLPADSIRMRFNEKNMLFNATFYSRADVQSPWRYRQKGLFYNLTFDHTTLLQETVSVGPTADRYWRVEISGDAWGSPQTVPALELGWLPHELLFVARGQGPFLLAFGSARLGEKVMADRAPDSLARIIGNNAQTLLKEAKALSKIVLGGPDQLTPEPPPLPWRKWLLWLVLVVGVGLIAVMARSLAKRINKEKA